MADCRHMLYTRNSNGVKKGTFWTFYQEAEKDTYTTGSMKVYRDVDADLTVRSSQVK